MAYLCAVTAAAFTLVTIRFLIEACGVWLELPGSFESATSHNTEKKLLHLWEFTIVEFFIGWLVAALAAVVPFLFGIGLANEFRKRHWLYFAGGATITALSLLPLFLGAMIDLRKEPDVGPEPAFHAFFLAAPTFAVSGAMAGLACWLVLHRTARS
jgi:hypothetical protein